MAVYRKKRSYVKKITKKSYARKASKLHLNKTIRKVVHRMAETKIANIDGSVNLGGFDATNWNTTNVIPVSIYPSFLQVTQGSGQGERIGNKLEVSSLKLRMVYTPRPYNVTTNPAPQPQMIKMFLVNGRTSTNYNLRPTVGTMATFFQEGNSFAPPSNNLFDMIEDVNKDSWNIYATKTIKLGCSSYDGTGSLAASQYFQNNDYKLNHLISWDITKHIPKQVTFNDTAIAASSRNLFLVILTANADGSAPVTTSVLNSVLNYDLTMGYKDI